MITCTFENGNQANLRHVTVGVILLNEEENKILLVKRADTSEVEPGKFDIPGGYANRDESTKQVARREVHEETGYEIEKLSLFRVNDDPRRSRDSRKNVEFIYLGTISDKTGKHDDEISKLKWYSFTEMPQWNQFAFDRYAEIELILRYKREPFVIPHIG